MIRDKRNEKKIWFAVALFLLVITICRETGVLNLNWYRNNTDWTTLSNWTDIDFAADIQKKVGADAPLGDSCGYGSLRNVPVVVLYAGYQFGDTGSCKPVTVMINEINYGFVYSPMYKSTHFSATGFCTGFPRFSQDKDSIISIRGVDLSGTISIDGHATMYGFLSARSAREQIRQAVMQEMYNQAIAHLRAGR